MGGNYDSLFQSSPRRLRQTERVIESQRALFSFSSRYVSQANLHISACMPNSQSHVDLDRSNSPPRAVRSAIGNARHQILNTGRFIGPGNDEQLHHPCEFKVFFLPYKAKSDNTLTRGSA